jgi:long-chain acyl-CoA synthetase
MVSGETLASLFQERVAQSGDKPAIFIKREGSYRPITWRELAEDARRLAAGLQRCGVAPGDRVIQFSENRYEWVVVDFAIQLAQAVHVPVHAPLTGPQAAHQISDCGAKVAFVSTGELAAKLRATAATSEFAAPVDMHGVHWFSFESGISPIGRPVRYWRDLMASVSPDEVRSVEKLAADSLRPESLATILYTSGTTGEPKGVMLTQNNLVSNAKGTVEQFEMLEADRRLNFLPLSHIFARLCDLYTWLVSGYQLALAESRETVIADCAAFHPTLLNGVPYFYDRVRRTLIDSGVQDTPNVLRGVLGGEIRLCATGGAALPVHVFDFYWERDVPLVQGYGLTESSPVISMSTIKHVRRESSGRALRGVEIRIAEDGEILTRGPHVMLGYYRKPQATAEVIRDGWLHTGDLGRLDEDGYLFITGRKKEILVTSGGKNIAAVHLEALLTEDPLILQAVVIGDGRDFLAALIVPNRDPLRAELAQRGIEVASHEEALNHPAVLALFEERIRQRLQGVSAYEQVRKFRLLDRGFTIDSGELTPKLSLRRREIENNYRAVIEDLYRKDERCFTTRN